MHAERDEFIGRLRGTVARGSQVVKRERATLGNNLHVMPFRISLTVIVNGDGDVLLTSFTLSPSGCSCMHIGSTTPQDHPQENTNNQYGSYRKSYVIRKDSYKKLLVISNDPYRKILVVNKDSKRKLLVISKDPYRKLIVISKDSLKIFFSN